MKSRILAFFSRALPQPTMRGFFTFFLFWLALLVLVVPVIHLFERIGELVRWEIYSKGGEIFRPSILHLMREVRYRTTMTFDAHSGIISTICGLAALVLASVQYSFRRGRRHPLRQSVGRNEVVALLLTIIVPLGVASPLLLREWRCIKASQSQEALWRPLYFELCQLHEAGDVKALVLRMEETYHIHQQMKGAACPASWEHYKRLATCNSGTGYFFQGFHPGNTTLEENFPQGVVEFLMSEISVGGEHGFPLREPDKWINLASAMAASELPLIRACGLFLSGDYQAFSDYVHDQVSQGDEALEPLLPAARDWARQSQENILSRYLANARYRQSASDLEDACIFHVAGMIAERGGNLGANLPAIQEAGRRWQISPTRKISGRIDPVREERFRKLLGIE